MAPIQYAIAEPIVQPNPPSAPASRMPSQPMPASLTSIQPASGMITSLGSGMHALSIAIAITTPGQPSVSNNERRNSTIAFSMPCRGNLQVAGCQRQERLQDEKWANASGPSCANTREGEVYQT